MLFNKDAKGSLEMKTLIGLGGYIPCPDHRIAPDAKWENVIYYAEKLRKAVG